MQKHLLRISALSALALLSACSSGTVATVDLSLLCGGWQEITVSKDDKLTEKTAQKIEGNNEGRADVGCPPDPSRTAPKKPAPAKTKPTPGPVTS